MTDQERGGPKKHAASAARILTTGITVAAGVGLVGAMGVTAQSSEPKPGAVYKMVIPVQDRQVIVVQQPQSVVPEMTVLPQPAEPAPAADQAPVASNPPKTVSSGS